MQSLIAILLVTILNLLPADVKQFTLTIPEGEALRFTRQADGGWQGRKGAQTDGPVFHVAGTQLTVKTDEKEFTHDLGPTLGLSKETNWKELKELKAGQQMIAVERSAQGLDFVLKRPDSGQDSDRRILVRWGAAEPAPKP
jgi:hypothetical protein